MSEIDGLAWYAPADDGCNCWVVSWIVDKFLVIDFARC